MLFFFVLVQNTCENTMEFETFLAKVKNIVGDGKEVTQDVTDTFKILSNLNQEFQVLQKEYNSEDQTMEKACLLVLRSSYVVMKCCAPLLFTLLKEMKDKKSILPQRVQPIITEIESYITSMRRDLDSLEEAAKQISSKVRSVKSSTYTLPFALFSCLKFKTWSGNNQTKLWGERRVSEILTY